MAQAMVNFFMDEDLKGEMEKTCKNMERLEHAIADVEAGRSTLKEHELIEAD